MKARELASYLQGVRPTGDGFMGRCPAHNDQRASLSFQDGERGVLVKCHAGCSLDAVTTALGLRITDLFHDDGATSAYPSGLRIVATYAYHDEAGTLLYEVVRFAPKDFRQRRPDGQGRWTWRLNSVRRVLYRLPLLRGQAVVYIAEGEKDADRLADLGIPATTNAGGAGKWSGEYTTQLVAAGAKRVVILPDHDPPGEAHALAVARACLAAGLVVKIVRLSGLPGKGDVSDWLDAGHAKDELVALVKATPLISVDNLQHSAPVAGLPLTPLGDLLAEPDEAVSWLVEDRLPSAGLSLLAGKPKAGKSTLARCLALAVARGDEWLGFATHSGPVFYLALEEKRAEVKRHFQQMGATADTPLFVFCAPSPTDGLSQLRESAEQRKPVLIVIDPLFRFTKVKDANDYAQVTAALEPLLVLARETGAHVLVAHHMGKGERGGGDGILGSTAIFGSVDTALILQRRERYRMLSSLQRYGPDLEEITLTLDPVTRIISAGPSRQQADEEAVGRLIVEYLQSKDEPVEEKDILEGVEAARGVKVKALRRLVEEGKATRTGAGKKGDTYRYSVSCFLVPTYIREQTKQASENHVSSDECQTYSCSRDFAETSMLLGEREQANLTPWEAEL